MDQGFPRNTDDKGGCAFLRWAPTFEFFSTPCLMWSSFGLSIRLEPGGDIQPHPLARDRVPSASPPGPLSAKTPAHMDAQRRRGGEVLRRRRGSEAPPSPWTSIPSPWFGWRQLDFGHIPGGGARGGGRHSTHAGAWTMRRGRPFWDGPLVSRLPGPTCACPCRQRRARPPPGTPAGVGRFSARHLRAVPAIGPASRPCERWRT